MEELTIRASSNFVNGLKFVSHEIPCCSIETYRRVKIDENRTRNIFARASFRKEGLEGPCVADLLHIWVWSTVLLQAMFKKVPAFHG